MLINRLDSWHQKKKSTGEPVSGIDYRKLQVLVADDFSNFRATVTSMLARLGISQVDLASHGNGVIELCQRKPFDLILCDYNLGSGKNGQHVLEELRHRSLINASTLFIIVSAEAQKDVVMAAYDCEPHDYLMKPITARNLQRRIDRLLIQRQALLPVYSALHLGDLGRAIQVLIRLSLEQTRHAIQAQKLLGELFIQESEWHKAEKLYNNVLEGRPLDWARLGLARVQQNRGDLDVAGEWLAEIIRDNPLFLPAYDVLAQNWEEQGRHQLVQQTVQESVIISPKSILRQKRLAQVAEQNGDFMTALGAWKASVKLGELSCHASAEDNLHFARLAATVMDRDLHGPVPLAEESIKVVNKARDRYSLTGQQRARATLLEIRCLCHAGNTGRATMLAEALELDLADNERNAVVVNVDRVWAWRSLGVSARANALIEALLTLYAKNQAALEQLDAVLEEPVSDSNRELVGKVNREGIALYNQARFDDAIACFNRALSIFPRHVGIQLNITQALMGKLRKGETSESTTALMRQTLSGIATVVNAQHPQYSRYKRLRNMAEETLVISQ